MQGRFARVRTQNDHLARAARVHRFDDHSPVPFLCECDDDGCQEFVGLTLPEYAALGSIAFFTAPGHRITGGDRTGATDTYELYLIERRRTASE